MPETSGEAGGRGTIRRAGARDLDAVVDVWWQARQAAIPAIPAPAHPRSEVRAWLDSLIARSAASGDVEVWVATSVDGLSSVVAVLVLDGAELDQLYVLPDRTGVGFGSLLVVHAQRRRPDGLALWTFQANQRARAFYRRHGFVEGRTTDAENEEGAPDIRLTWRTDELRD